MTVTDSTQYGSRASAGSADRESTPAIPRASFPEAVVFPRDGKPLDQRPTQLRQDRASARYRRDGGEKQRREAQP